MKRISASEKSTYDLLPHLHANRGSITDKVEDVAGTSNGRVYVSTDHDGGDEQGAEHRLRSYHARRAAVSARAGRPWSAARSTGACAS